MEGFMGYFRSSGLRRALVLTSLMAAAAIVASSAPAEPGDGGRQKLDKIQHIVVIYEENHSFDNVYGGWEGVNGRADASAANTTQVGQGGVPYTCLLQNDVNLTSPPLSADCTDTTTATPFTSHFMNALSRSKRSSRQARGPARSRECSPRTVSRPARPTCLAAAREISCTGSTKSSTSSTTGIRTGTRQAATPLG
jgi:hypothetical protein